MTLLVMLFLCVGSAVAQNVSVKGTVFDENSEPVIGATVRVKGSTDGAISDLDGRFTIGAKVGDVITISYVGYNDQEVKVKNGSPLTITLQPDQKVLNEVVVIGYGTTKAKNFTGSVDVLNMKDSPVADMGMTSLSSMLRGRLAGVNLSAESGMVGGNPSIQIRGQKSIGSTSENPLIVLNGVIYPGNLNDIDPQSIESVSVLKDATSLAAYGSKAANGVIMVTTKKGSQGKPTINFTTSHEFSTPSYKPEFLDGPGYIRYRNAKTGNPDLNDTSWMSFIEKKNYEEGKTTDWYDLATRTGYTQSYNLNVSGAGEGLNYYAGVGHNDMKGMVVGNHFVRNFANMNISANIAKWLKVGGNFNLADTKDNGVAANLGGTNVTPYGEPYLTDGRWRQYIEGTDVSSGNPLWNTYNGVDRDHRRTNMDMGAFISIDIPWVEGLNFRWNGTYARITTDDRDFTHETNTAALIGNDWDGAGYTQEYFRKNLAAANGSSASSKEINWVHDFILSYSHDFGPHYVSGSLVYTRDYTRYNSQSYSGSDFSQAGNTILGWYGLGNAANKTIQSPVYWLHTNVGYLARVMYSYNSTYHFNASVRRDGSSVFGADKKWGVFPAFGAAWTISNEKFMEPYRGWLDNLKLKLSWGKNGAQTLEPYGSLTKIAVANDGGIIYYPGGNTTWGQAIATLGNPDLGWQTTTSWNGGFEADFFGRRLHFELNAYKSQTTDQIFNRNIPIMTAGVPEQKATMGQVNNWGIEINANSVNIKKGDFTWETGLTFSLNRNKLVELYGDGQDDIVNSLFIGKSLGALYGYRTDGIFQDGEHAGTPIFLTKDGEQTANPSPDDRVILGYTPESFRMNLSNTLRYKDFSLYIMFAGKFSGGDYGKGDNTFAYVTYNTQVRNSTLNIPFWTPDNPSNEYPSPSFKDGADRYRVYNNNGYIRLQDISLTWSMKRFVTKWGLEDARLSLSGRNLFYIAPDWKRSDPENYWRVGTTGDFSGSYGIGMPKAVSLTLSVTY